MTQAEYAANKSGLNIFFGAIIGVIMADVDSLNAFQYSTMLMSTAGLVVTLLYIGASRRPVLYALLAGAILAAVFFMANRSDSYLGVPAQWIFDRYLPVFGVWLTVLILVELAPRERATGKSGANSGDSAE